MKLQSAITQKGLSTDEKVRSIQKQAVEAIRVANMWGAEINA